MATDLSVILEDRPGELAKLGEATGLAGVNINNGETDREIRLRGLDEQRHVIRRPIGQQVHHDGAR